MTTLYHYIHCPFCIRVRMALGFLNYSYISKPLDYHDEQTPVRLTNVKMLPILEDENGAHNESLDIIKKIDTKNLLSMQLCVPEQKEFTFLNHHLSKLGKPIHNLCMPYWAYSKEFTPQARDYFIKKKEVKRGPFAKLIQNKSLHLDELKKLLVETENLLKSDFLIGDQVTILDIMLASHLWGMYVFPEFQFSPKLHSYLQRVGQACSFSYHEDLWRD